MDSSDESRLSPSTAILSTVSVEITEEESDHNNLEILYSNASANEHMIFDNTNTANTTHDDALNDLDNIEKVINGFEDNDNNDSDVEIVVEHSDQLLMGSQILQRKFNCFDGYRHKRSDRCEHTHHEKQIRIELQQELELERQQRIQFQQQLQEYMQASLQRQFEDSAQIKQLKLELLKCKQQLQITKNSETTHTKHLFADSLFSNKITDRELECRDCGHVIKSEVSMILHMINHNVEEQDLHLLTTVFKLDSNDDTVVDSNISDAQYCCPRCNVSFNCVDIYYHLYKYHTKEQPLLCTSCKLFFTHLDYLREHHQQAHDGIVQNVIYANLSTNPLLSKQTTNWQRSQLYKGINHNRNTYKPYMNLRSHTKPSNGSTSSVSSFSKTETNNASIKQNKCSDIIIEDTPEIIQISDSPTPSIANHTVNPKSLNSICRASEHECTFADCDFKTTSKDKLDFHISAHTNSKFKCPYCPYVGNVLNDIYRHIQKSKKHEGLKIYECRECDYGTNCVSTFKDHLTKRHFINDSDEEEDINDYIANMFRNEHSANSEKSDSP